MDEELERFTLNLLLDLILIDKGILKPEECEYWKRRWDEWKSIGLRTGFIIY